MNKRLLQYMRIKGISQRALSARSGVNIATVSRFCNGSCIGSDNLCRLLKACDDLSLEWILRGEGEMLKSAPGPVAAPEKNNPVMDALAEKDRVISERDRAISERDQTILDLLGMLTSRHA